MLKRAFIIARIVAAAMLISCSAQAAGECVYPLARPGPSGNLVFVHPIYIYDAPNGRQTSQLKLFVSFIAAAEQSQFLQITGSESSDPDYPRGQTVGWIRRSDFVQLPQRNCNMPSGAASTPPAARPIDALFDTPAARQIVPGKSEPNSGNAITCTYYADVMIRETETDSPAPGAATLIPVPAASPHPPCGKERAAGGISLKSENHSLLGRKGPFLLFRQTDPNGAAQFLVIDATSGKVIYTDTMMGDEIKGVTLENGLLRLRFTRGANGSCSLIKDGDTCWAKLATERTIPAAVARGQPPIQACIAAYRKHNTPADDPSIVSYEVDMTLSSAGKPNVISRGSIGCSPLP
jgi:hypothetical protein